MTMVVVTHAVGDMETWLKGGEHRKAVFSKFCSNHRIFKHAETNRVSILCENVDLAKMQETMGAAHRKLLRRARRLQTQLSTRSMSTSRLPAASEAAAVMTYHSD